MKNNKLTFLYETSLYESYFVYTYFLSIFGEQFFQMFKTGMILVVIK